MASEKIDIFVTENSEAQRIDKYLSQHPDIKTRSRAEHLLDAGCVLVNGKIVKSSYKVKPQDHISVILFTESISEPLKKLDLDLDIVFEDSDIIVVNKPAGLVVHPAAGHQHDTLVNALMNHTDDLSMKFSEDRPGIVHRIDKETSGLLVIAKNDLAHAELAVQFKDRTIHRFYEAVVLGNFSPSEGKITSYLARHPTDRKRYASVKEMPKKNLILSAADNIPQQGKLAITNFKLLLQKNNLSLLQLKLETGRTHQIRVHLSEKGFPILGDNTYGASHKLRLLRPDLSAETKNFNRFFLHAKTLGFIHPKSKQELYFERPWPQTEIEFIKKWISNDYK